MSASFDPLIIDEAAVSTFVEVLFGSLGGFVPVRILAEKGGKEVRTRCYSLAVGPNLGAELAKLAGAAAQEEAGLFVTPATMLASGRGKAAEINETVVVVVDLDEGDIEAKLAYLARYLGEPTLEIASGGVTSEGQRKRHVYWGLSKPASGDDLRRVVNIRRLLAEKVGGDPAFGSPAQLIRVAGSIHAKSGEPRPVEVIAGRPRRFDLGSFEAAALDMPAMKGLPGKAKKRTPVVRDLMTRAVRENGVDGVTRHDAMTSVIGHWLRQERLGLIRSDEAWRAVSDHNAALIRPSWAEEKLRREFERLRALDLRNHGVPAEARVASLTEDGLARAFAAAHADCLRHVDGQWHQWTSSHWQPAGSGRVVDLVRVFCKTVADDRGMGDDRRLLSLRIFKAVEELARCDQRLTLAADAFDCDPMLLNTPDGIIDLRTGEVRPGDPGANLSRTTLARPGRGPSPRWRRFIAEVTQGDAAFAAYLARVAGYCLTGRMGEQAFFFFTARADRASRPSSRSWPPSWVATRPRLPSTHSWRRSPIATRPSSRGCTAPAWSPVSRSTAAAPGTRVSSRRSPAAIASPPGACTRTSRSLPRPASSCSRATTCLPGVSTARCGAVCNAFPSTRSSPVPDGSSISISVFSKRLTASLLDDRGVHRLAAKGSGAAAGRARGVPLLLRGGDPVGQWLDECCVKAEGVRPGAATFTGATDWAENRDRAPFEAHLILDLKPRGLREFRNAAQRGLHVLSMAEHDSMTGGKNEVRHPQNGPNQRLR